jgi:hypothetical protein
MRISYFHTSEAVPAVLAPAEGGPDAAVAIDVLRATTTIAWSLQNGAEAIQAFADLEALERAAAAWPEQQRLRAGERGGKRVEGYDLGNSPLAVTPELVGGKRIFMSTTNGTRSLPWPAVWWRPELSGFGSSAAAGRAITPWRTAWRPGRWCRRPWNWRWHPTWR